MTLTNNLRSIAHTLGGDIAGRNRILCPGPGHSRKDRSLSVTFNGDSLLCHSFCGDDWRECKDYVKALLGLSDERPQHHNDNVPVIRLPDPQEDEDLPGRIRGALKRWETSGPIAGTLAETYLALRGLTYSGDAIRFRVNDRSMVALMTDAVTNEPTGVHVTYIDSEGRKIGRRMYGRAAGAAVKLSPDDEVTSSLALAEGIETALAVPFRPVWACLSAGTMAAFPVLAGIDCLSVFADNDASGTGLAAAKVCAERWHASDREVLIHIPAKTGVDYATKLEVA